LNRIEGDNRDEVVMNNLSNNPAPTGSSRDVPPAHALAAFDAVANLGSLAMAAEYLGVTRSAVSHRLALLETSLGFEIIKRCGRNGITLTPQGQLYAERVHQALEILSAAQCWTENAA